MSSMPKISRNKLDPKAYAAILKHWDNALADLRSNQEITGLMESIFTNAERLMVAKRLAIATLLEQGWTYPEISRVLKVSSTTISFVKNRIMKNNEIYIKLIRLLQKLRF